MAWKDTAGDNGIKLLFMVFKVYILYVQRQKSQNFDQKIINCGFFQMDYNCFNIWTTTVTTD